MPDYGPIQVLPPGFLGLLQLKTTGRVPDRFNALVQPTFEMQEWYLRANAENLIQVLGAVPGIALANAQTGFQGFSPNAILIPQEETWFVHEYTIDTSPMVAGDQSYIRPAYRNPLVGTQSPYILESASTGVLGGSAGTNRINVTSARGFWVPPGSELGLYVMVNESGATITYNGYARVTRIQL